MTKPTIQEVDKALRETLWAAQQVCMCIDLDYQHPAATTALMRKWREKRETWTELCAKLLPIQPV